MYAVTFWYMSDIADGAVYLHKNLESAKAMLRDNVESILETLCEYEGEYSIDIADNSMFAEITEFLEDGSVDEITRISVAEVYE